MQHILAVTRSTTWASYWQSNPRNFPKINFGSSSIPPKRVNPIQRTLNRNTFRIPKREMDGSRSDFHIRRSWRTDKIGSTSTDEQQRRKAWVVADTNRSNADEVGTMDENVCRAPSTKLRSSRARVNVSGWCLRFNYVSVLNEVLVEQSASAAGCISSSHTVDR